MYVEIEKLITITSKVIIQIKILHIYWCAMSQNSPVDGLQRDKNTSDFTKNLIENYGGGSDIS